jgi:uncharacterized protein (TIGR00255 family)
MIRSMTGYGEAERSTPAGRLRAEVKTVNHRFFSANLRLPSSIDRYEPQLREWLRAFLPRGHVNFALRIELPVADSEASSSVRVDLDRARQYLGALTTLRDELRLPGEIDVALLSRFGDMLVPADEERLDVAAEDIQAVTEAAARVAVAMREVEGQRLGEDLEQRLAGIESALVTIAALAPQRLVSERDRMRRVVKELAEDVSIDEDRLAREVAFLAERWDISEELVRLRAHIDVFRDTLAGEAAEPVGKRLGFLIQEMHREANTIGSKANDAAIEHQVIAIKDEIERLREQVENVE